jgi:hypothetical protein
MKIYVNIFDIYNEPRGILISKLQDDKDNSVNTWLRISILRNRILILY